MRYSVVCDLSNSTIFFPHYFINAIFSKKKMVLNIKCALRYSIKLLSEIFLIPRRTEWDMVQNVNQTFLKYLLLLPDFNEFWILTIDSRKNTQISYFHENPSSGSRVVPCGRKDRWTDGQTDMTKFTVDFRNFANAPKIMTYICSRF